MYKKDTNNKGMATLTIILIVVAVVVVAGGIVGGVVGYNAYQEKKQQEERVSETTTNSTINTSQNSSNSTTINDSNSIKNTSTYNGDIGPLSYTQSSKSTTLNMKDGSTQTISGNFKVYQYNIETGNKTEIFSFTNSSKGYATTIDIDGKYIPCYKLKEVFSDDMSKLAVTWFDVSDSSHRVGWLDKNGNLTDITNIIHPTTSDFSSKVPYDTSPVFTPDGQYMFADHNKEKYVYVDINSKTVVKEEDVMRKHSSITNTDKPIWNILYLPNGKMDEASHYTGTYDYLDFGDYQLKVASTKDNSSGIFGYDLIDSGVIVGINHKGSGNVSQNGKSVAKYGVGYSQPNEFNSYDYSPDNYATITPETDYSLERCVYHNGRIAFTGTRGSERYLFVINDGDGEQSVRQVVSIPKGEELLFWR